MHLDLARAEVDGHGAVACINVDRYGRRLSHR
jgi:hypothetical protein